MEELLLDVALSPAELASAPREAVAVVVDVLRATSTITVLLARGARRVYPVGDLEAARARARGAGLLLGGERGGLPLPDFDFGNSPVEALSLPAAGKDVVLTTTNGTRVVERLREVRFVLAGCFLNATACSRAALELAGGGPVLIACAGEGGRFVLDDAYCTGYLAGVLASLAERRGLRPVLTDAARAARAIFRAYPGIAAAFEDSASGRRLLEIGRRDDLEFSARVDALEVVPVLVRGGEGSCWFEALEKSEGGRG